MKLITTITHTQEVSSIASGTDVFVKSAILDDIRKEAKDTRTCPCDDYEVCAYENIN